MKLIKLVFLSALTCNGEVSFKTRPSHEFDWDQHFSYTPTKSRAECAHICYSDPHCKTAYYDPDSGGVHGDLGICVFSYLNIGCTAPEGSVPLSLLGPVTIYCVECPKNEQQWLSLTRRE